MNLVSHLRDSGANLDYFLGPLWTLNQKLSSGFFVEELILWLAFSGGHCVNIC